MTASHEHSGTHDFDFHIGSWHIVNERLKSRLTNSDEWERFEADGTCWPILGGMGNAEDFRPNWPGHEGYEGAALRLFDPTTGLWSIYWMDTITGTLFPPVVGRFVDGVGDFFGDDMQDGTPVLARFRWTDITADAARWEQAFSTDGGATWEVNWIMTNTRQQATGRERLNNGGNDE